MTLHLSGFKQYDDRAICSQGEALSFRMVKTLDMGNVKANAGADQEQTCATGPGPDLLSGPF